jgi:hypothetical protein
MALASQSCPVRAFHRRGEWLSVDPIVEVLNVEDTALANNTRRQFASAASSLNKGIC